MPLSDISDEDLIRRAIKASRARDGSTVPRWAAVADAFALGSTYSVELCQRFDVDPNEVVPGRVCEACADRSDDEDRDA